MRGLLVLSRIALICNVFFLFAFSLQVSDWLKNEELTSMAVILGYVFAFALNPFVNTCYLVTIISRKKLSLIVPAWIVAANVLFLVIQLFYIVYINK